MNEAALGRFGDKRREDLGAVLLDAVESKRTLCIHRLAEDRNQTIRFNNFLANPAVSTHEMLVTAGRKTNQCAAGRHVLAIMDTTDVLFPSQKANKRGFGLGSDGEHPGLFLHPVLGVDAANGGIIGLVNCIVLNRTEGRVSEAKTGAKKKVKTHKKRTADDKESRRWLQGSEMAGDCLTDADMITMVGDREGDIYHLLANRPANVHLLVRSAQPRALTAGGLLPDYCAALPEQARETIDVPAKGKQPARKATVAMRYGPVSLKRPANSSDNGQPETVSLWVVDVQEIDPPEGVERVHWRLLTTHTVTTLEQARQIVAWYRMRWTIDIDQAWRLSRISRWMVSTCNAASLMEPDRRSKLIVAERLVATPLRMRPQSADRESHIHLSHVRSHVAAVCLSASTGRGRRSRATRQPLRYPSGFPAERRAMPDKPPATPAIPLSHHATAARGCDDRQACGSGPSAARFPHG